MTVEELLVHCMIIASWCPPKDMPTKDKLNLLEEECGYLTAMQYLKTVSTIIDSYYSKLCCFQKVTISILLLMERYFQSIQF